MSSASRNQTDHNLPDRCIRQMVFQLNASLSPIFDVLPYVDFRAKEHRLPPTFVGFIGPGPVEFVQEQVSSHRPLAESGPDDFKKLCRICEPCWPIVRLSLQEGVVVPIGGCPSTRKMKKLRSETAPKNIRVRWKNRGVRPRRFDGNRKLIIATHHDYLVDHI